MKKFTRTVEDFVCGKCGLTMHGNGFTNHCSNCLWSKHVDIDPGDRQNPCQGLMEPIAFDEKKGILHRCEVCKFEKYNKVQPEDNFDRIVLLSALV